MDTLLIQGLQQALQSTPRPALRQTYQDQDEFAVIPGLLPESLLDRWRTELEALKPHIHRNFIPKHKKGGSVPYDLVERIAVALAEHHQAAD